MNKTIELTPDQFTTVQSCVEFISASERDFSEYAEQLLKEVAEIFNAEYTPEANVNYKGR